MSTATAQLRTTADLARLLQVSERTIRRYRAQGLLPAIRVGGLVRFDPDAVDAFLATSSADLSPDTREPGSFTGPKDSRERSDGYQRNG